MVTTPILMPERYGDNVANATADLIIKVATKYIGYLEKKSNKLLDDLTANAGRGNYTRFAREYKKFAGVDYQAQAWCCMYINSIFVEAFGKDKAKELLIGFSAYTPTAAQYFKSKNKWYTEDPQIGDLIFFKNNLRICHIGLVTKVTDTTVYTIEGNTSDGDEVIPNGGAVCEKVYKINNPRIAGYGRPNYDVEEIEEIKYFYNLHEVKSGQYLSKIASIYNTTVDKLVKLNGIQNPDSLKVGQVLKVNKYFVYKTVKGDYLGKVAKVLLGNSNRYKEIMEWNLLKITTLKIGQELKIYVD